MSRIHDALKKLEAERAGGGGAGNGHGNGHGGGGGNGNGRRRGWQWLLSGAARKRNGQPAPVNFDLGPEVEEAYQRLGTSVLVTAGGLPTEQPKLLGVVASRHGEGTTTTAAVFAAILVRRRGGRVAVVEANLRSPSFETAFGVRAAPGLTDVVEGKASLADVAQPTTVPNLFAIAGGNGTGAPAALFDSPGLPGVLTQLREHFDFTIIDLPPVNVYGDALIIGPRLDASIIVIEADATRVPDVERARRTLERSGVRFVGSVLNRRRNYIPAFLEEML
jgi:capsular exopolysaccharide synthesis family protein